MTGGIEWPSQCLSTIGIGQTATYQDSTAGGTWYTAKLPVTNAPVPVYGIPVNGWVYPTATSMPTPERTPTATKTATATATLSRSETQTPVTSKSRESSSFVTVTYTSDLKSITGSPTTPHQTTDTSMSTAMDPGTTIAPITTAAPAPPADNGLSRQEQIAVGVGIPLAALLIAFLAWWCPRR